LGANAGAIPMPIDFNDLHLTADGGRHQLAFMAKKSVFIRVIRA
jgi:hypothetical protein